MPSDIRSFFGGKPAQATPAKTSKKDDSAKKQSRGKRKIVDESDDDDAFEVYVLRGLATKLVLTLVFPALNPSLQESQHRRSQRKL